MAFAIVVCTFVVRLLAVSACAEEFALQQDEFFEKKIRPVLVEHCYQCHRSMKKVPDTFVAFTYPILVSSGPAHG
jgi:hypothetical protein